MFNGLKKIRLRFKLLIAVSLIIFSLLYIFSYGIILPLTEGTTSFYIANIIYYIYSHRRTVAFWSDHILEMYGILVWHSGQTIF